jgi:DNA-binding PadR family transcriptional regulator
VSEGVGSEEDARFSEWILDILSKDPQDAAEIIKMSRPWFPPTPESIFPILESLQKEA